VLTLSGLATKQVANTTGLEGNVLDVSHK